MVRGAGLQVGEGGTGGIGVAVSIWPLQKERDPGGPDTRDEELGADPLVG